VDTDRPDDSHNGNPYENVETTSSIEDTTWTSAEPAVVTAPPKSRLLLAILAGLAVVALGVAAWAALFMAANKEYPGITVVFALVIAYVVREVSRRSDFVPGIVAALLTAVLVIVGNVAGIAAGVADQYKLPFLDVFRDLLPDAFTLLTHRPALTLGIFAAAVLVAFFLTIPSKPRKAGQST
jgi:hypothetical protein